MKRQITFFKEEMMVMIYIMLACFITLPTLHAQSVLPNVRVNTLGYEEVSLDGGAKSIVVINDTVYAIWQGQPTDTTSNIYFAKSMDGGASFSNDLNVSQGTSLLFHAFPSLAVSQDGTIHITWAATNDGKGFNVWYIKSTNGGNTFDTPIEMTTNNGAVYSSIAAFNNNVYIIYANGLNYPLVNYYFTRSTNNGNTFGTPIQINDAPCTGNIEFDGATSIALDPAGNLFLAWVDGRRANGNGDIYLSKSTDGGLHFSTNVMVNDINQPGADSAQFFPSITADASNNVYVSFCDGRLGNGWANTRVHMARSNDGGNTFSTEVLLAGHTETCSYHNIVANSTGKLYAALCTNNATNWGVWLYESVDGGNNFSPPLAISDSFNNQHKDVRIVLGDDKEVYALWRDNRAGLDNIYFTKTNLDTSIT